MKETKFNKKKAFITVPFNDGTVQIFADYAATIEGHHFFIHKRISEVKDGQAEFIDGVYTLTEFSTGIAAKSGSKTKVVNEFIELTNKPENNLKTELAKYPILNIDTENHIENVILAKPKTKNASEKLSVKSVLQGAKIFYEKNEINKDVILFDKKFIPFVFELCENAKGLEFQVIEKTITFEGSEWVAGASYGSGKYVIKTETVTDKMLQITHNSGSYNITLCDTEFLYFIPTLKAICAQYSVQYINTLEVEFEQTCENIAVVAPTFEIVEKFETVINNKPQIRKQRTKKPKTLIALPLPQIRIKDKRKKKRIKPEKTKINAYAFLHKKIAEISKEMGLIKLLLYSFKYPLSTFARWLQSFSPNIAFTPIRQFLELKYSPSRFFTNNFQFRYYGIHASRFRINWSSG